MGPICLAIELSEGSWNVRPTSRYVITLPLHTVQLELLTKLLFPSLSLSFFFIPFQPWNFTPHKGVIETKAGQEIFHPRAALVNSPALILRKESGIVSLWATAFSERQSYIVKSSCREFHSITRLILSPVYMYSSLNRFNILVNKSQLEERFRLHAYYYKELKNSRLRLLFLFKGI